MDSISHFDFDFDFGGRSRADLLAEAKETVHGLRGPLGPEPGAADPTVEAASRLLTELEQTVAEFSAFPQVLRLEEKHFADHGLPVPRRFQDLSQEYRFYWLHFPMTLKPLENSPFVKLKCAVEFNPGIADGRLRPRAHMILPDKKFKQLLEFNDSLELRIGENFEFEAASEDLALQAGELKATGKASVDAKVAGNVGLLAGPFTYRLKRAQVDHSPVGTEKVFWTLDGAEFFQEDDPTLIAILQVPLTVDEVKIAAALQAYHQFSLLAGTLGEVINYLRQRLATFFRQGAPVQDTQVWDISPSL